MDYPKYVYHPNGTSFICPSLEFLETLDNHEEYEDAPFTGPRKITQVKCRACQKHINDLRVKDHLIESLRATVSELQDELKSFDGIRVVKHRSQKL